MLAYSKPSCPTSNNDILTNKSATVCSLSSLHSLYSKTWSVSYYINVFPWMHCVEIFQKSFSSSLIVVWKSHVIKFNYSLCFLLYACMSHELNSDVISLIKMKTHQPFNKTRLGIFSILWLILLNKGKVCLILNLAHTV